MHKAIVYQQGRAGGASLLAKPSLLDDYGYKEPEHFFTRSLKLF